MKKTVEQNGKIYEVVDPKAYVRRLARSGAEAVYAEKSGCVIIDHAAPGTELPVYTSDGRLEAPEVVRDGCLVLTRADMDGNPVVDEFGHENCWQAEEDKVRKKYDVGDGDIASGTFAKPKGGEQAFMRADRDIAIMVPWGEGGALIPLCVEKGGYLNVTDMDDVYGIAEAEFGETYHVNRTGAVPANVKALVDRGMPDVSGIEAAEASREGPEV